MGSTNRCRRLLAVAVLCGAAGARADDALRSDAYVETVLRSHPASQAARALDDAAAAETLGARLLPDPTLEMSLGRGQSAADSSVRATETGIVLSQVIPWLPARWLRAYLKLRLGSCGLAAVAAAVGLLHQPLTGPLLLVVPLLLSLWAAMARCSHDGDSA